MKRTLISMVVLVLAAVAVGAQNLTISYVEGHVELQRGQSWQELNIGDSIPANATVRLGADSYLEIAGGAQTISLSQSGSYAVNRLLSDSRQMSSAGVGSALSARLVALFGTPTTKSATMGVRAKKAEDDNGISWVTSDAQVYVDSGKEYIKSGDYQKAVDELKQAVDYATGGELPEAQYYLGYAYSLAGNTRDALKQVGGLKPGDVETVAADLVILKGTLLLDTSAFEQNVHWLTENAGLVSGDPERGPVYYLLLGLSYNGVGDKTNARENLQKVVSLAGSSDLGTTAATLLQQL